MKRIFSLCFGFLHKPRWCNLRMKRAPIYVILGGGWKDVWTLYTIHFENVESRNCGSINSRARKTRIEFAMCMNDLFFACTINGLWIVHTYQFTLFLFCIQPFAIISSSSTSSSSSLCADNHFLTFACSRKCRI